MTETRGGGKGKKNGPTSRGIDYATINKGGGKLVQPGRENKKRATKAQKGSCEVGEKKGTNRQTEGAKRSKTRLTTNQRSQAGQKNKKLKLTEKSKFQNQVEEGGWTPPRNVM